MNNKFALILLALVGVCQLVACAPGVEENLEEVVVPSDVKETSGLKGKLVGFADFCISSRDYIISDVKSIINRKTASGFGLLFNWADEIGKAAHEAQTRAAERLAGQLNDPDAIIDDKATDDVDAAIIEGQKQIQEARSAPRGVFQAVASTLSATKNSITSGVFKKFQQLKEKFGPRTLIAALDAACHQVELYERELRNRFEVVREKLYADDEDAALLQLENVPCATSKQILQLDGFCRLGRNSHSSLLKIWGVTNNLNSQEVADKVTELET